MIPLRRWSRFSLRTLFLAVTVSAVPLAWITSLYYGYHRALREFSRRHVEATQAIEDIYARYRRDGQWPLPEVFDAAVRQRLPEEWTANGNPSEGGPMILLHGPWHSMIAYRFVPPEKGEISKSWELSVEGDLSHFQSDVDYSASDP